MAKAVGQALDDVTKLHAQRNVHAYIQAHNIDALVEAYRSGQLEDAEVVAYLDSIGEEQLITELKAIAEQTFEEPEKTPEEVHEVVAETVEDVA